LGNATKVGSNMRGDSNVVAVRRNGRDEFYRVKDPLLLQSLTASYNGRHPLTTMLQKPSQWLRSWFTKNPEFMLRNLLRDSLSAYLTSGADITPLKGAFRNVARNIKRSIRTRMHTIHVMYVCIIVLCMYVSPVLSCMIARWRWVVERYAAEHSAKPANNVPLYPL